MFLNFFLGGASHLWVKPKGFSMIWSSDTWPNIWRTTIQKSWQHFKLNSLNLNNPENKRKTFQLKSSPKPGYNCKQLSHLKTVHKWRHTILAFLDPLLPQSCTTLYRISLHLEKLFPSPPFTWRHLWRTTKTKHQTPNSFT